MPTQDPASEEIGFLEQEVACVDPRDRRRLALLHLQIVRLMESRNEPIVRLVERAQKAVEICPEIAITHRTLRRYLSEDEKWDDVLASIDAEMKVVRDPSRRATMHLERGRILRDVLKRQDGVSDLNRAMTLEPASHSAVESLRTLYTASGDWDQLIKTLEKAAGAARGDRVHDLRGDAAMLAEHVLDKAGPALTLWNSVLEKNPDDPLAIEASERLHAASGRWSVLLDVLVKQAEGTDSESVKFSAYMRAATIAAERLDDTERALGLLALAADVRADDPAPVEAMAELHRRAGDFEAYDGALARRMELASTVGERSLLAATRASVLAERLNRPTRAAELLLEVSKDDPANGRLNHMLRGLFAAAGRERERVEIETLEAERIGDDARRAAAMFAIGQSCEAQHDGRDRAVGCYIKTLHAVPGHRGGFEGLRRIYEKAGAFKDLAELIERRLLISDDETEKRMLLRRLASVRETRLGDPEASIDAFERLRKLGPPTKGERLTLWNLQRLYSEAEKHEQHIDALVLEADLLDDPESKAELHWHCGIIWERRLEDLPRAIDAHERALEILPSFRPAHDALSRIAEECGDWLDHLKYLDRGLEGLPADEQADRLVRSARFAAEVIGDENDAVARCCRALELVEGHAPALRSLAWLYERTSSWAQLAEVMEKIAATESDARQRARMRTRIGDLLCEHLDASSDAVAAYGRALKDVEGYLPAIEGMERVGMRVGGWDGLVDTYRAGATASTGADQVRWLRKLAVIRAFRLERHQDALTTLGEILSVVPDDPWALRLSTLLHIRSARWAEAAMSLARISAVTDDPALSVSYRIEAAWLLEKRVGEDSSTLLQEAQAVLPGDREVLEILASRAGGLRDVNVLEGLVTLSNDAHEKADLLVRLAEMTQDDERVAFLDRALEEIPGHLSAIRIACRDAQIAGDLPRTLSMLELEGSADVTCRPAARVEALSRAADIASSKLGDPERARRALEQAFEINPGDASVARRLSTLLREQEQWRALADALGKHAAALEFGDRSRILLERASVLRDYLQSPGEAAVTLEQLLRTDPGHAEALIMIGNIQYTAGSWRRAVESFSAAEGVHEQDTGHWRHARLKRVEVLADHLGLFDEAETLINQALASTPGDREMLAMLARVRRGARNWTGVEAVLGDLIRTAPPSEAVGLWVESGRVAIARKDQQRLATCITRAAQLSLEAPEAFRVFERFVLELDPQDVAHLLKDVLFHAPPDKHPVTGPMHLLVARLMDAQQKTSAAESEVRVALQLMPDDVGAWILLARTTGSIDEALSALSQALQKDPFQSGIYEGLSRLGDRDPAYATLRNNAARVLTAMGYFETGVQPPQPPMGDKRLLRHQVHSWVIHPLEPRVGLELLEQGGLKLGSLYPQSDYGPLQPVPRGNEVSLLVDSVAKIFGVEKYNLFYTAKASVTASYIVDEKPSVIIGESMLTAPEQHLRFHLGRVFALLSTTSSLAHILSPDQVRALVEAMAGQAVSGLGEPVLVQRVAKVLGWIARRGMKDNAARLYAATPPDLSGWQHATTLTAARGGLIACSDITAAREALHALAGVPLPSPGADDTWEISRSVPMLGEVLRFAVSAEYASVRSHLG